MGKACPLTWSFQKRAETPANSWKENLFLRGKERREKGGKERKWQDRGGKVAENFAGHCVSSPINLSDFQ